MQLLPTLLLAGLTAATAAAQTIVYVTPGGTGDGTSWANATGDLAGAMASVLPGTDIWVAQGTYRPTTCATAPCSDAARAVSFELRPQIKVIGGFLGGETDMTQADPANVTTLSGDIGVAGDPTDNSYNVVYCDGCGQAAELANLTISDGYADRAGVGDSDAGLAGAGLYLRGNNLAGGSPTISRVRITGNESFGQGGGVYIYGGFGGFSAFPTFVSTVIADNVARGDGGGVYLLGAGGNAQVTMTDCRIEGNRTRATPAGSGRSGGGVFIAGNAGGRAFLTLERCVLTDNLADPATPTDPIGNSSANGGAIYMQSPEFTDRLRLTAHNTVFSRNTAYAGASVYSLRGVVEYVNVTTVGNRSIGSGGSAAGLYTNKGRSTVVNSIFADNRVTENTAADTDFRIINGRLEVRNTIVSAADADEAVFCGTAADCEDVVYVEGPGVLYAADPAFANADADVPVLTAGSPAVDAGFDTTATGVLDLLGDQRSVGASVDLGAVEFASPLPVTLVAFDAAATADGRVEVAWTSAAEELAGYELSRGRDGVTFESIDWIAAVGSGDYRYLDDGVRPGQTYYYRLRGLDADGTTYDSDVAAVTLTATGTEDGPLARVYPNPASAEVSVALPEGATAAGALAATLYDALGRVAGRYRLPDDTAVLPLSDVPDGTYVLRVEAPHAAPSTRLTIQR